LLFGFLLGLVLVVIWIFGLKGNERFLFYFVLSFDVFFFLIKVNSDIVVYFVVEILHPLVAYSQK